MLSMASTTFDRYLKLLGVEPEPPSLDHLARLVTAQIIRVPFENLSKLLQKRRTSTQTVPTFAEYLNGVEHLGFGGTCYVNNPYFNLLLRHVGYDTDLYGADMSNPDVHIVSIVRLEGREYLVDVGYGAPFYEPIPSDLTHAVEISWGNQRYVLHPRDPNGRSRLDHYHEGQLIHGYTVNPIPRTAGHFAKVIRGSYDSSANFMNALVIERFYSDRSVRIHNLKRSETNQSGSSTRQLISRDELVRTVHEDTGIPLDLVHEAVDDLKLEGDIYS
jgi:arylamine N-acetyltransferase